MTPVDRAKGEDPEEPCIELSALERLFEGDADPASPPPVKPAAPEPDPDTADA